MTAGEKSINLRRIISAALAWAVIFFVTAYWSATYSDYISAQSQGLRNTDQHEVQSFEETPDTTATTVNRFLRLGTYIVKTVDGTQYELGEANISNL